jgi:hypothetical protein
MVGFGLNVLQDQASAGPLYSEDAVVAAEFAHETLLEIEDKSVAAEG